MIPLLIVFALITVLFSLALISAIPGHLQMAAYDNCHDADGNWQWATASIELRRLLNLVFVFSVLIFALFAPVVLGALFVNEFVMPLPMLVEVMGHFADGSLHPQHEIVARHRQFLVEASSSAGDVRQFQKTLYLSSPGFVVVGLILGVFGLVIMRGAYISAVTTYRKEVLSRWAAITVAGSLPHEVASLQVLDNIARQRFDRSRRPRRVYRARPATANWEVDRTRRRSQASRRRSQASRRRSQASRRRSQASRRRNRPSR